MGLPACKSHKATVVRAGAPAVTAKKTSTNKTSAKTAPKPPSLDSKESNVDSKIADKLVKEARHWIGTPYRYGQKSRKGTDCSGFVMTVFSDVAGVDLPRSSAEQCSYCFEIPRKKLQAGDLVFFTSSTRGGKVTHVGLYIGDGKMIHASTSRGVIESGLDEKYYASHYHSSGRVQPITIAATGGKNKTKGDSEEIRLAKEGVKADAPKTTQKQSKPSDSKSENKAETTVSKPKSAPANTNADTGNKKSDKKAAAPAKESITLDQFVNMSAKKNQTDTVKASTPTETAKTAENPKAEKEKGKKDVAKPEQPKVMVNGKPVTAQPAEKPQKKNETASTDSVRQADAIRNEVSKAMKFGK